MRCNRCSQPDKRGMMMMMMSSETVEESLLLLVWVLARVCMAGNHLRSLARCSMGDKRCHFQVGNLCNNHPAT